MRDQPNRGPRRHVAPAPPQPVGFYASPEDEAAVAHVFEPAELSRRGQALVWAFLVAELQLAVATYVYQRRVVDDDAVWDRHRGWRALRLDFPAPAHVALVAPIGQWPNEQNIEAHFALDDAGDLRVRCVNLPPGARHLPEVIGHPSGTAQAQAISRRLANQAVELLARYNLPG